MKKTNSCSNLLTCTSGKFVNGKFTMCNSQLEDGTQPRMIELLYVTACTEQMTYGPLAVDTNGNVACELHFRSNLLKKFDGLKLGKEYFFVTESKRGWCVAISTQQMYSAELFRRGDSEEVIRAVFGDKFYTTHPRVSIVVK